MIYNHIFLQLIALERLTLPIDEIQVKYPNLTRACQWIGDLTSSEEGNPLASNRAGNMVFCRPNNQTGFGGGQIAYPLTGTSEIWILNLDLING